MTELALALALALVIEGAVYALFPDAAKRMMGAVQQLASATLRWTGVGLASAGTLLVWLIQRW